MFFANKGNAEVIAYWDELVAVMSGGTISGLGISTPSVTNGTAGEENIKKIVCKFASIFPDVAAILVLSFRIDFEGNPHVIELHADLTGDLILDILLPASLEGFDPWSLALEVATRGTSQIQRAKCVPTTLYYGTGEFQQKRGRKIIQEITLERNLQLVAEIMGTADEDIVYHPKHLEWLLKHTSEKDVSP